MGQHQGLSLEWHLKRRGKRGAPHDPHARGVGLRLCLLKHALALPKFAQLSEHAVVFVADQHLDDAWSLMGAHCMLPLTMLTEQP